MAGRFRTIGIIALFFILGLYISSFAQEQLTITTYYPSPYGVYNELRLYPRTTAPTCDSTTEGTMYYDNNSGNNELRICREIASGSYSWSSSISGWTRGNTKSIGGVSSTIYEVLGSPSNTGTPPIRAAGIGLAEGPNAASVLNWLYGVGAFQIINKGYNTQLSADSVIFAVNNNWGSPRVGIGTASPSYTLDVAGTTYISGNLGVGIAPSNRLQVSGTTFSEGGNPGIFGSYSRSPYPAYAYIGYLTSGYYHGVLAIGYHRGVLGMQSSGDIYGIVGYWDGGSTIAGVYGRGRVGSGYDFLASGTSGTSYGIASSVRWKKNIKPINNALDKVLKMRGVYFDWDKEHGGRHSMGMIAEEVGKQVPEVVVYEKDSSYATGMDYGKLTPVLVEAIKEQQQEIEKLKAEIESLKKR